MVEIGIQDYLAIIRTGLQPRAAKPRKVIVLPISPFRMENPQAYYYFNGQKFRIADCELDPTPLGFEVAEHERGQPVAQLWATALRPIIDRLESGGEQAWAEVVAEHDQYSVREYLEEVCGWSEGAIESGLRAARKIHPSELA